MLPGKAYTSTHPTPVGRPPVSAVPAGPQAAVEPTRRAGRRANGVGLWRREAMVGHAHPNWGNGALSRKYDQILSKIVRFIVGIGGGFEV
jgi:hypothetical protein